MKLISSAILATALLAMAVGAASAAAATETVSLGVKEETSLDPAPVFEPPAVEGPVSFKVTYTATPATPLLIATGLLCTRGSEHPGFEEDSPAPVTPPDSVILNAPAGSDSCALTAFTETQSAPTVATTVRIEAEAVRSVKVQPPPAKQTKKKCKKGKRLKHGKCVKQHSHR